MFGFELEETGKISHQMKETARRFIEKGNLAQLLETLEKVTKENIYFYNKKLNSINNRLNVIYLLKLSL